MKRDIESSPLFRAFLNAVILAALIALGFFGADVEEANMQALREFVSNAQR